jgi:hypothetical protein
MYADPDADIHPVYDRYTAAHDELIVARAQQRLRNFNARVLGARRPTEGSAVPRHTLVPQGAPLGQIAMDNGVDLDPLQWESGFIEKRTLLIEHFNLSWNAKKVAWLTFPKRKRR